VTKRDQFLLAIEMLRTPSGRTEVGWANPFKWTQMYKDINTVSSSIYGSDESAINSLISIKIKTLIVQNIGCFAGSKISFQSTNQEEPTYWGERWEYYRFSYAMAVWAWGKGVDMIEILNEPDTALGVCLDSEMYEEYYYLRGISIQNAYSDLNEANPSNKLDIKIVASGFARVTYGGDLTKYLGDVSVKNKNFMFDKDEINKNWTNMHIYSFHVYDKTGYDMLTSLNSVRNSIKDDTTDEIPVILTEFNTHTAGNFDKLTSTADSIDEASRFASLFMYLIGSKMDTFYAFKFSITPISGQVKKNGIYWGENYMSPFHISDSTLSGEAARLLSNLKKSEIFVGTSTDTSKYRTYLGSRNSDGRYYLYAVNDKNDYVSLKINISQWNIAERSQIIVETVGTGYFGEVSQLLQAPKQGNTFSISLTPFSTTRLTIPQFVQQSKIVYSEYSCTARAGTKSSFTDCYSASVYVGTSNTIQHENTSVSIIQFAVPRDVSINQKTILKLNVNEVIGDHDVTAVVLGFLNPNFIFSQTHSSWTSLSSLTGLSVLTILNSGSRIDSVSKNFINWSSLADISIVGHITAKAGISGKNENRMLDVSDYVSNIIEKNSDYLTFLIYRPFRHPSYKTNTDPIPEDNLSNGSLIKLSSNAELIHYWQ